MGNGSLDGVGLVCAIDRDRSVGDSPTFCVATKEGDSPTFILCCYKGGRLVHIHTVLLQRRASRPPSFTRQMTINHNKALPHSMRDRAIVYKDGASFVRLMS